MGIVIFPREERVAIERPREINAVEGMIAAVAAFVDATGGSTSLGARDLDRTPLGMRIRLLGEMYAAGRVELAWRDGRDGRDFAATLEKRAAPRTGESWRIDVRTVEVDGVAMVDVLAAPDIDGLARMVVRALAAGFARGDRRAGARIAQFAH